MALMFSKEELIHLVAEAIEQHTSSADYTWEMQVQEATAQVRRYIAAKPALDALKRYEAKKLANA